MSKLVFVSYPFVSKTNLPTKERNSGLNHPEFRRNMIFTRLSELSVTNPEKIELVSCPSFQSDRGGALWDACRQVHDSQLVDFLLHAWDNWKKEGQLLTSKWTGCDSELAIIPEFFSRYNSKTAQATKSVYSQISALATDNVTPIFEDTWKELEIDIVMTKHGVDLITQSDNNNLKYVYVGCTHPGHHAGRNNYGGYCFINNACIALKYLTDAGKKPFLLDVDYHMGDGSIEIIKNGYISEECKMVSIHAKDDYPYATVDSEWGIELDGLVTWNGGYKDAVIKALEKMPQNCDVIVVSLGLDTLEGDPHAAPCAELKLTSNDFYEMAKLLKSYNKHILVMQEGGYFLSKIPDSLICFANGISE
eukprot:c19293_g1_i1.p1 GENE.c19293_g1_i1~~c19293_g1_i1.p1  ORF type:complete len:363 (+),score=186.99 c19293_g1_i1:39-1127(+)